MLGLTTSIFITLYSTVTISFVISSLVTIVTIAIMSSDSEAIAISVEVSRFIADETTNPEDRLALVAFLKARPKYSESTNYISDIEQRLQLLREIQQKCENHALDLDSTSVLWSAMMVAPLERLRYFRDMDFEGLASALNIIAIKLPMLLKVCMLYC